ncbi:hypothetical protein [Nakamurella lactea]|nr:hypothetical protein [Nakamurella lactea]
MYDMNTEAMLRMLEHETRDRVTNSRRRHGRRRVLRRIPAPADNERRVF